MSSDIATAVPRPPARSASAPVMTGAEAVVRSLDLLGVTDVFGLPGGAIMPVYDPLMDDDAVRHILVRHEQGAGHAAEGYASASGKVGVAIATSGPGATNLVTAIADAYMDSVPLLCITGQVFSSLMGTDAFQEADIVGITMPITKHSFLVKRAEDIPGAIAAAYEIASTGRPGPVLVDITKDAQQAEAPFVWPPQIDLPGYRPVTKAHGKQIQAAAQLIAEAEKPVLYVGGGIIRSRASEQLRALAEATGAPVVTTLMARGAFPDSHEQNLGMPGMHGTERANYSLQDADLVLGLGIRFDDRVIGRPDRFAPNARIVHFDIDATAVERTMRADIAVVADLSESLKMLLPLVPKADRTAWWERIREWNREADPILERRSAGFRRMGPLGAREAIRAVARKITQSQAIAVSDVGQHQMWLAQELGDMVPGSHLTSGGLGAMGYALPAGLGAAIGRPERPVWVVIGDGGFQMTLQELATIVQEDVPLRIAVIDNGYLGMVRQWQERFYERRYSETRISGPDLVTLGKAYGIPTWRIDRSEQLDSALGLAANEEGPVLIWLQVRQEENVYPMVPSGAALDEMVTKPKHVPG